jgi:hypothetical protein
MAVLRAKRNRRKRKGVSRRRGAEEAHTTSETNCKGPNVNKRHRKPDEIYGDTSIPDSARRGIVASCVLRASFVDGPIVGS